MDAIDYAESAGDAFLFASAMAFGIGAIFAMTWWLGQAGKLLQESEQS